MTQKFVACIFLSLFLLTIFAGVNVNSVSAIKRAMEWGYLNDNIKTYNLTRYNTEFSWEGTICTNVNSMFAGKGWSGSNSHGASTTRTNVYNELLTVGYPSNGVTTAATFWVGDFMPSITTPPTPFGYFGCYTSQSNSSNLYVWDYEIYQYATTYGASKNYFTFMWTCSNGGLYWLSSSGGYSAVQGIIFPVVSNSMPNWIPSNSNTYYGYRVNSTHIVGMPYAWTGTTGMSTNGYTNPSGSYTYIGWESSSPFMIDTPPSGSSSTNLQYLYFVYNFYNYALGYVTGYPEKINTSLNYAAEMTFGRNSSGNYYNFGTSVLNVGQWLNDPTFNQANNWFYCKLRVFGNGNTYIQ
jgi:hypothetical protein